MCKEEDSVSDFDVQRYIKNPNLCPFCSAPSLVAEELKNVKAHLMSQNVSCTECDEKWVDVYTLATAYHLQETEEEEGTE